MVPVFAGQQRDPHPWLYFQFSNNRAIRVGDRKLVSAQGGPWELYDLSKDRSELHDLAKVNPDEVREFESLWHHVAETVEFAPANLRRPVGAKTLRKGKE